MRYRHRAPVDRAVIWCATGHRPDKLGGYASIRMLEAFAEAQVANLKPSEMIVGMALGWDTQVAVACIHLGIPFVAAIPFDGQESRWPAPSQLLYRTILGKARTIHVVSEGGYSAPAMQIRNQWMVDHAQGVLALHDGSPGGTGNCMRYAQQRGIPLINVWPAWNTQ